MQMLLGIVRGWVGPFWGEGLSGWHHVTHPSLPGDGSDYHGEMSFPVVGRGIYAPTPEVSCNVC